jgi:hypothetical protein
MQSVFGRISNQSAKLGYHFVLSQQKEKGSLPVEATTTNIAGSIMWHQTAGHSTQQQSTPITCNLVQSTTTSLTLLMN